MKTLAMPKQKQKSSPTNNQIPQKKTTEKGYLNNLG
jgi:hypothetical protein